MDWVNITAALVLPIVGWLWGKLSNFERQDAKLATAIEGLNKTTAAIWSEIKELRKEVSAANSKMYVLEQKIRNEINRR